MSLITTIIDGLAPSPSTGLGGANEGYIQGFQDDLISGVAGGVADKAGGQCLVTENSPLGMSVLVADGVVYVPNADYIANLASTTKYYRVIIKDSDPVVVPSNSSGSDCQHGLDVVVDKVEVPNEYASNVATIVLTLGTPGAGAPAVPDNGYRLSEVEVVSGATQIANVSIIDVRAQIVIDTELLSSTLVTLTGTQTLTNKTLTSPKVGTAILDTNGNEIIKTPATASAVNEVTETNAATGTSPIRLATGGDTNIGQVFRVKGTGVLADDGPKNYAADAGANDTYAITVVGISAYFTGQIFRFKANTVNTGAATLNVNSLGAKTIVKNYNATLADGDILANQLVEVIYDGTNFQLLSPISNVASASSDGWTAGTGTWTYSSVDDPTGIISINADMTSILSVGMRIRFVNGGNTIYGKITVVGAFGGGATLITFLHQINTASPMTALNLLANSAITAPYYSSADTPFGFPSAIENWTFRFTDSSQRSQGSVVSGTVYNPGSLSLAMPIGKWRIVQQWWPRYSLGGNAYTSLSTSSSSSTTAQFTTVAVSGGASFGHSPFCKESNFTLASKTTYYIVIWTDATGGGTLYVDGAGVVTTVELICAY